MTPFRPFFPINPMKITQAWGNYDPKTYSQFGFTNHNGTDIAMAPDKIIRAPFDGTIVRVGNQPKGGGIFVGIESDVYYDFPAFTCVTPQGNKVNFRQMLVPVLFDFLHCEGILVSEGDRVKAGTILAVQDNTGFSTGPHTHIQVRRGTFNTTSRFFVPVDINNANNTFDPTQFYNGLFADKIEQAEAAITLGTQAIAIASTDKNPADQTSISSILLKVGQILSQIWK